MAEHSCSSAPADGWEKTVAETFKKAKLFRDGFGGKLVLNFNEGGITGLDKSGPVAHMCNCVPMIGWKKAIADLFKALRLIHDKFTGKFTLIFDKGAITDSDKNFTIK